MAVSLYGVLLYRQKNNRIYGNAANQVLRSPSDDDANIRIFFEYFLLFYPIYVFSLIIRLVFSIYTKACYQCIVRRNVFDNNYILFLPVPEIIPDGTVIFDTSETSYPFVLPIFQYRLYPMDTIGSFWSELTY